MQEPVIYSRAILVKRVMCKSWTGLSAGALTNNLDPDQTPQNAASDQCLHSLLKLQEVKSLVPEHFPSIHTDAMDPEVLSVTLLFCSFALDL